MKILSFDGFLAKDAEIKTTPKGSSYLSFRVGNTTYIKGENKTEFIGVTSFNSSDIEHKTPYLKKGTRVYVSGTLDSGVRQGKDGRLYNNLDVLANFIEFPGNGNGKKDENSGAETTSQPVSEEPSIAVNTAAPTNATEPEVNIPVSEIPTDASDEDDLPF